MPETDPVYYHTSEETDDPVFHDNNECIDGNNIEKEHRIEGKGEDRDLCNTCDSMAKADEIVAAAAAKKAELREKLALNVRTY